VRTLHASRGVLPGRPRRTRARAPHIRDLSTRRSRSITSSGCSTWWAAPTGTRSDEQTALDALREVEVE